MKFSFAMPNTVRVKALTQPFELDVTGADQTVMAKRAEELGYDMIPIPEHFIVPTAHVELSGPHYFHSTVAQAFIAGATQRIGSTHASRCCRCNTRSSWPRHCRRRTG